MTVTNIPAQEYLIYAIPDYALPREDLAIEGQFISQVLWVSFQIEKDGKISWKGKKRPERTTKLAQGFLLTCAKKVYCIEVLEKKSTQENFLYHLQILLKEESNLSEVQFDWEYLPPHLASAYNNLLARVHRILWPRVLLSATVFPQLDFTPMLRKFPHFPSILQVSDRVVVMLYDRHGPNTSAGCVSPMSWLRKNINYLERFNKKQILLGVPLYGYCFRNGKARAISRSQFFDIKSHIKKEDGCYVKETADKGQCYYPSEEIYSFFQESLKKGFAGLAFWRLGFEN
ncbi:MAG: glycosyl hydrolase family 18 protein [Leptospiraceae bacterium]|nr:glycosyl hydrolase family 18 protein [Leptospiraceae bacterium]